MSALTLLTLLAQTTESWWKNHYDRMHNRMWGMERYGSWWGDGSMMWLIILVIVIAVGYLLWKSLHRSGRI